MSTILVAFWTKTGTTQEYAAVLAQALRDGGHTVDVKPFDQAASPDGYDAIVLGAPINGMRPVPALTAYIAANAAALSQRPTALFAVSYMYGKSGKGWTSAMAKGVASAAATMGAKLHTIVPGKIDAPMPGLMRVMFGVPKDLPLDRRDPAAMQTWATEVAALLR
ncbi:MAG: hypothetical protein JXM71_06890 [Spirochaetales bacterium]|nr:hypothetical protein [Spirochaetales bacterium]